MPDRVEPRKIGLPTTHRVKDPEARRVLESIIESVEVLMGVRGNPYDWAIRRRDMTNLGLLGIRSDNLLYDPKAADSLPITSRPVDTGTSFTIQVVDMTGFTQALSIVNGVFQDGWTGNFQAVDQGTGNTVVVEVVNGVITTDGWDTDFAANVGPYTVTVNVKYGRIAGYNNP